MTEEKIPYLQCLYHTGKKVYKYWFAALAIIGIIIGLYFVVASQFEKINNVLNAISNALGYVGYVLTTYFNNAWSLACTVPWYWWAIAGVVIGPFILVSIYCALKHYNVDMGLFIITVITIVSIIGVVNFIEKIFYYKSYHCILNELDVIIGILSVIWLTIMFIVICGSYIGRNPDDYY